VHAGLYAPLGQPSSEDAAIEFLVKHDNEQMMSELVVLTRSKRHHQTLDRLKKRPVATVKRPARRICCLEPRESAPGEGGSWFIDPVVMTGHHHVVIEVTGR
jgi:hypothetical protein